MYTALPKMLPDALEIGAHIAVQGLVPLPLDEEERLCTTLICIGNLGVLVHYFAL